MADSTVPDPERTFLLRESWNFAQLAFRQNDKRLIRLLRATSQSLAALATHLPPPADDGRRA